MRTMRTAAPPQLRGRRSITRSLLQSLRVLREIWRKNFDVSSARPSVRRCTTAPGQAYLQGNLMAMSRANRIRSVARISPEGAVSVTPYWQFGFFALLVAFPGSRAGAQEYRAKSLPLIV